jgi:CRP/FNR family transcriptional regulator, cyclic AMP receptor protein
VQVAERSRRLPWAHLAGNDPPGFLQESVKNLQAVGGGVASISAVERRVLLSNPWFAGLPGTVFDAFVASAQRKVLKEGERLFSRGDDPGDGIYVALTGSVRLSGTSAEGREAVFTFFQPGNLFAEVGPLDGEGRSHDATAHVATTLLNVSRSRLEVLLAEHPSLCRSLLKLEAARLRLIMALAESYATSSLEKRFAGRLLALGLVYGTRSADGIEIQLRLPQETLARLAGVSRQRVNQLLKGWESQGLIRHGYGRITLVDVVQFERLAEPHLVI